MIRPLDDCRTVGAVESHLVETRAVRIKRPNPRFLTLGEANGEHRCWARYATNKRLTGQRLVEGHAHFEVTHREGHVVDAGKRWHGRSFSSGGTVLLDQPWSMGHQ